MIGLQISLPLGIKNTLRKDLAKYLLTGVLSQSEKEYMKFRSEDGLLKLINLLMMELTVSPIIILMHDYKLMD